MIPKKVKVSAVTAVYNQEDFISQTIESVLALGDAIEEYVILDDCSTDGTLKILEDYAAKNPIIKLLRNEKNMGVVYSFNRVSKESKGTYVLGVAGDDYFMPEGLLKLINFAKINPGVGLYLGDIDISYVDKNRVFHDKIDLSKEPSLIHPDEIGFKVTNKYIPSAGILIAKDLIVDGAAYCVELKWLADWFVTLVVAFKYGVGYVPETTVTFRYYNSNFSSQGKNWKLQREVLEILLMLLRNEYRELYPKFVKAKLFNSFQAGMGRLLLFRPSLWDRYTVKIIIDTFWRYIYLRLCSLFPASLKNRIKENQIVQFLKQQ